jgi:hypothetical protein
MTEEDVEKIKNKQSFFSKIQNFFTMGYGAKEDLREIDKKTRDRYFDDFREVQHLWEDIYLAALDANIVDSNRDFKKVIQILDRVMEKVRHADYGYAGLMDRKGHIREEELARVYKYDKRLGNDVSVIKQLAKEVYNDVESENWDELSAKAKKLKGLILDFENKLQERKDLFRPLDI